MAMFELEIVTPRGLKFSGEVRHVRAPGVRGYFGVLAGHTPFITPLATGEIDIDAGEGLRVFATSGGFAEVHGDHVLILAETAEEADEIDRERALAAKRRAEERLSNPEGIDHMRARAALARALNRLKIAGGAG